MAQETQAGAPSSPENQDESVREELDQEYITHQGDYRASKTPLVLSNQRGKHLGATDDEVVPVIPPMAGPADLVGESNPNAQGNESGNTEAGEESIDPRDELTPG
jgi:hypothetical protein